MASMHVETLKSGTKSYVIRWRDPMTGKQVGKRFPKHSLARSFKTKVEHDVAVGTYVDPALSKITVADMVDHYIATAPIGTATRTLYEVHARLYIKPRIGAKRVGNVTTADVRYFIASMTDDNVGTSTVVHVHQLLRAVMSMAVEEDRIPRNPAARIKLAKKQPRDAFFLTSDQVDAIAGEVGEQHETLVYVLAYAGLRIGEALSLKVGNVDTMRRTIEVIEGGSGEGTKTRKTRVVPVPRSVSDRIAQHVELFSQPKNPQALVFPNEAGQRINVGNWRSRVLYPAAGRAGVLRDGHPPHPHDLRHTAASLWASAGFSLHEVSRMLGHSSIVMTGNLYTHLFPDEQSAKMDRFDEMVSSPRHHDADVIEIGGTS